MNFYCLIYLFIICLSAFLSQGIHCFLQSFIWIVHFCDQTGRSSLLIKYPRPSKHLGFSVLSIIMSNIPHLLRDELIMVSQCCHTSLPEPYPQWAIVPSVEYSVLCMTVGWSLRLSLHLWPHTHPALDLCRSACQTPFSLQSLPCCLKRNKLNKSKP